MVLEKLKNIFKFKKKNYGILYKQNDLVGENELIEIDCNNNQLIINNTSISFYDIFSIKKRDKRQEIFITTKLNKYIFITVDYEELYNIFINQKIIYKNLYKSTNFKYLKYESYDLKFKSIELIDPEINIYELNNIYYFVIEEEPSIVFYQEITSNIQNYIDQDKLSFVWSILKNNIFETFALQFNNNIEFLEFSSTFIDCTYKSINQNGAELDYYKPMFIINNTINTKKNQINNDCFNPSKNNKIEKNKFNKINENDNFSNKHLIVTDSNVFITRGNSLGVFDPNLHFKTQITNAFDDPTKIISYNKNLIVQSNKDQLDLLDLERGEIVENWKLKDMNDFFNAEKNNNETTLIGLNDYSIFRIDPRTKEKIVEKKDYKIKNKFLCGIGTENGNIATASANGDLRLYNDISKKAKTLINGFGDPVIGIDTSKNGLLILCTCKSYILLYQINSDYSKTILNKDKKPPKRLQIKPEHLSLMKNEISFTPAKFNQNDEFIITSTGKYLIKWKTKDILNGNIYNYYIKTLNDKVIDENFITNNDHIVVALPNDIQNINNDNFQKP